MVSFHGWDLSVLIGKEDENSNKNNLLQTGALTLTSNRVPTNYLAGNPEISL